MNSEVKKKSNFRETLKFISTIISWTVFTLLILIMVALVYYFVAVRIYAAKGSGHEPKFSLYTIITPSMTPNINVYDVVVDVKVDKPEDIKINDVITFNSSIPGVHGGTITHRVIAINKDASGNYHYTTKGDYNLVDDGVDVEFANIVGKVALRIPQLGRVQFFLATKAGWLICVLVPAVYVIIKDIFKIIKLKTNKSDGKFSKFLNRPLISFKKRKLLPYTPQEEIELKEKIKPEVNNSFIKYYDNDENDSSKPVCPTDVVIPTKINGKNVLVIGKDAFSKYYGVKAQDGRITSVVLPETLTVIESGAFYGNKIKTLIIPKNVTEINGGAFENNLLQKVTFEGAKIRGGCGAFNGEKHSAEVNSLSDPVC